MNNEMNTDVNPFSLQSNSIWQSILINMLNFVTIIDEMHIIQYINHPVPGLDISAVMG
ncbi:MAG: hypothetical protein ACTSYI_08915 [Promethearchaeota archaeon]